MEIFDMLKEGLSAMFDYIGLVEFAGLSIFSIAFFGWFSYSVFRFIITPLLGNGHSWSDSAVNVATEYKNAQIEKDRRNRKVGFR